MARPLPLAEQLFTVLLGGTLEAQYSEQKVLMSLINLNKLISREITATGNAAIRIQHDAFNAIMLFDNRTKQLTNAMVRLKPRLFKEMLVHARSLNWLQTQSMREDTQVKYHANEANLSYKLMLARAGNQLLDASVAFFDYPGAFDAHTVHFRRECSKRLASGRVAEEVE